MDGNLHVMLERRLRVLLKENKRDPVVFYAGFGGPGGPGGVWLGLGGGVAEEVLSSVGGSCEGSNVVSLRVKTSRIRLASPPEYVRIFVATPFHNRKLDHQGRRMNRHN